MVKTNKTLKRNKSLKRNKTLKRNKSLKRNKTLKTLNSVKTPKINIVNSGFMKTVTTVNNKTNERQLKWDGNYDGKNATIHAKLNKDGKIESFDKTFNNNEIESLIGYSPIENTLEDRLKTDWPINMNQETEKETYKENEEVPIFTNDNNLLFVDKPMETRKMTIVI